MIALEGICIQAGAFSLSDVALTVPDGVYGVLMGPTGCGKTTLLEIICGLRKPSAGRVLVDGRDVSLENPGSRGIGYVPQDGCLFPTMTVVQQIGFALKVRRWRKHGIHRRVEELIELLGIGHLAGRLPQNLSGGERQRVAIGRALAMHPAALLLDEPLSALDEPTRIGLRDLLKHTQRQQKISVLHVTHDRLEAAHLADATFTLSRDGRLTSAGPIVAPLAQRVQ